MNNRNRRAKFKKFRIILVTGSSSSDRFQHMLILMMSHLLTSSISFLISGTERGSICAYKVTTCDIIYGSPRPAQYRITKISPVWISAEAQAHIENPPIPIIKNEVDDVSECEIIKNKIHQNLSDSNSETYKLNIEMFEHEQPE